MLFPFDKTFIFAICLCLCHSIPLRKNYEEINLHNESPVSIIGGKPTSIKQHPYQVAIFINDVFEGSGIIIDKRHVVTVASMVFNIGIENITFSAGNTNYERGQFYNVSNITINKNFNFLTLDNDVAVLQSATGIKFGGNVKKISIATKRLSPGNSVTLSGWGQQIDSGSEAEDPVYKEGKLKTISRANCQKQYPEFNVTNSMACAFQKNVGPCWFDFGNVIVSKNKAYGLFSWARSCDVSAYPSVYTDLVTARRWINSVTKSAVTEETHTIHKRSALLDEDSDELDAAIEKEMAEEANAKEEEKEQEEEEENAERKAMETNDDDDNEDLPEDLKEDSSEEVNVEVQDEQIEEEKETEEKQSETDNEDDSSNYEIQNGIEEELNEEADAEEEENEQEAEEEKEEDAAIEMADDPDGNLEDELDRNTEDVVNEENKHHPIMKRNIFVNKVPMNGEREELERIDINEEIQALQMMNGFEMSNFHENAENNFGYRLVQKRNTEESISNRLENPSNIHKISKRGVIKTYFMVSDNKDGEDNDEVNLAIEEEELQEANANELEKEQEAEEEQEEEEALEAVKKGSSNELDDNHEIGHEIKKTEINKDEDENDLNTVDKDVEKEKEQGEFEEEKDNDNEEAEKSKLYVVIKLPDKEETDDDTEHEIDDDFEDALGEIPDEDNADENDAAENEDEEVF